MVRIAKKIADAGICSRRAAEKLILEHQVSINGEAISSPAINVTDQDIIKVNGEILPQQEALRIWLYYKPAGLITSHNDPQNRPTIFENLPKYMPRVISVGRLDLQSEGLIILTNSGEFARKMELPSSKIKRIYKVECFGKINMKNIKNAEKGIEIEGEKFHPEKISLLDSKKNNHILEFVLTEGKNREIRKICSHFGLRIRKLLRASYGKFTLGNLKEGEAKEDINHGLDILLSS